MTKKRISLQFDIDIAKWIEKKSKEQNRSQSNFVDTILKKEKNKEKKNEKT